MNLCSSTDVTIPCPGVDSKIFGLNWQMEGKINWSVAVDVTTKHLSCMITYKLVNISSRLSYKQTGKQKKPFYLFSVFYNFLSAQTRIWFSRLPCSRWMTVLDNFHRLTIAAYKLCPLNQFLLP